MSELHQIVLITEKAGRGEETLITDSCPFKRGGNICKLELIECRYGLTEIRVPLPVCPLGMGVTIKASIKKVEK